MKKLIARYRIWWEDILYITLLLGLTFYAWFPLLQTIIRGNGYMYMLDHVQDWFWGRAWTLTGFESAAAISGAFFKKFYGGNVAPYLWTELFTIFLIGILFYIFTRVATKRKLVAFTASLFFTVNYFGNFDILVRPCYCYYMERVINVPFLIASLIFLQLFFSGKKTLFLSLLFYFLGIGLAHFSFFITGFFLFYPFFWYIFVRKRPLGGLAVGLSFAGISLFFLLVQQINESGFRSSWTFQEFLLNPQKYHYIDLMVRQLVYWSQYPPIIESFFRVPFEHQNLVNVQNAILLTPYVLLTYLFASIIIYKKLPRQRAMLFAVALGTTSIFYLNAYFGQYAIAHDPGSSRYLFFPTFLLSIFWALFFWSVFWQKKARGRAFLGLLVVTVFYTINVVLIHDSFRSLAEWDKPARTIYSYILTHKSRWPHGTLVIGDFPAAPAEAQFLTEQLGKGDVQYQPTNLDVFDWRPVASESAHVISLHYNKECDCVKEELIK